MKVSWYRQTQKFKSPKHVIPPFLLKSRENHKLNNKKLRRENKTLKEDIQSQNKIIQHHKEQLKIQQRQLQQIKTESENPVITFPVAPPVGQQGYPKDCSINNCHV